MNKYITILVSFLFCASVYAEIKFSPREVEPVGVGKTIPDANMTKLDGTSTTLSEAIGGKPSLIIFYRGGWCPYCMKHLKALKDVIPAVKEMGYEVIAISPDYLESVQDAVAEYEINYTILVDSNFEAVKNFELAFELDGPTMDKLTSYDITVKPLPGMPIYALPVPAVYVVDSSGTVKFLHYNPDYTKRLHPDDILSAVEAAK